ncbi:Outer membrane autotransporter barrel [Methylophilaceae bacterium]
MALASLNASATCTTGSAPSTDANTVTCTEGSSYSNAAGTTVSNTATIATAGATNSVVQLTGNGNTLTNAGIINNAVTYSNIGTSSGQFYGIYMGALPGTDIEAVNSITNSGTVSAAISATNFTSLGVNANRINTTAVVGVGTDEFGIYTLTNTETGNISASHNGVGRVNGVEIGGDVTSMSITNSGHITGTASAAIVKDVSTATSFTGHTANFGTAASIGVAAGIYAEEEAEALTITNSGTIAGVGTYASGIYTRAGENTITNSGTISGTKIGVAQVSDSGEIRTMTLDNSGTITGDILSVNGVALRWWSLSNGEATSGLGTDTRLNINSQFGQADSDITNSGTGTITGNFYYSNGTHVLTNEDGATITGNIDLDQRDTIASSIATSSVPANYSELGENAIQTAASGSPATTDITTVGTKNFTFENAGTFNGNIKVYTATGSDATLRPTINGLGATTAATATTTNINYFNGALQIISTSASGGNVGNVIISPVIASETMVTDGEYYKVANSVSTGTTSSLTALTSTATAAQLPTGGDNGLLSWIPSINASGALVVQAEVDADNVTGASSAAKSALTSLMAFNSDLGNAVQNASSDEVVAAGEQLRAEANNASYQAVVAAANHVSSVIGLHQDQVRAGATGVSSGEAADGAGFWLEAFGFRGDQKERSDVDGYQADTGGFVLGGDKVVGNGDARFGAAFAYGSTGISGKGANTANRTDIDSYQGIFYGSYNAGAWYADASLGYGRHQYDTKRVVSLVGANLTGSHNANQYSAKLGFGLPFSSGVTTITPLANLAYVKLDQNGYTESDRNDTGAALSVDSTKTESLRSGLGAKLSVALATGELSPTLEARAVWNHEFADTNQNITASFYGGDSFTTNGVSQSRDSANLGVGVSLKSKNGQTLSVNYDAEVKNDYVSHTAALKARFDF